MAKAVAWSVTDTEARKRGEQIGLDTLVVHAEIYGGTPVAKAVAWSVTDTEARKRGEQIGLDTLVVHAVNDEN